MLLALVGELCGYQMHTIEFLLGSWLHRLVELVDLASYLLQVASVTIHSLLYLISNSLLIVAT